MTSTPSLRCGPTAEHFTRWSGPWPWPKKIVLVTNQQAASPVLMNYTSPVSSMECSWWLRSLSLGLGSHVKEEGGNELDKRVFF